MTTRRKTTAERRHTKSVPATTKDSDGRTSFSEQDGILTAYEPELFRPGNEALCCRLAHAAARQADVRSVHVCLSSATCRMEFPSGEASDSEMAERFAAAVRAAVSEAPADPRRGFERGWTALTLFPHDDTVSTWETIREGNGALILRNGILNKDSGLARHVARELAHASGIASCRVTLWARDLSVTFDPEATSPARVILAAEDAFRRTLRPVLDRSTTEAPGDAVVASGLRRVWYIGLAGGSFALTLVGLVVPGVPTVPFLLGTSYYLVRSSPRLNAVLLESRFFGPILSDLERWGGLRRVNKLKLIGLTVIVSVVTTVIVGPPLVLVVVMFSVASASIYAIGRLPSVPSRASHSPALATADA